MVKFIRKLIIFAIVVGICFGLLAGLDFFVVGSQYGGNYQASTVDKLARLQSLDSPKIILVGHSNLTFGMHSQKLEQALDMPVVNLGLHGGLGNRFHEEMAKQNIGPGDIVVICHSDFSDEDKVGDPALAWVTVDNHPQLLPLLKGPIFWQILPAYPNYLRASMLFFLTGTGNRDPGGAYSHSAFNTYGDIGVKPESGQMDVDAFFARRPITVPDIDEAAVARLNQLNRFVLDRGAVMVVAGYPIAWGAYAEFTAEDFAAFRAELDGALDCPVISDYSDYFFPYRYFYDTYLHLTEEGAEARTDQLIRDLQNFLAADGR